MEKKEAYKKIAISMFWNRDLFRILGSNVKHATRYYYWLMEILKNGEYEGNEKKREVSQELLSDINSSRYDYERLYGIVKALRNGMNPYVPIGERIKKVQTELDHQYQLRKIELDHQYKLREMELESKKQIDELQTSYQEPQKTFAEVLSSISNQEINDSDLFQIAERMNKDQMLKLYARYCFSRYEKGELKLEPAEIDLFRWSLVELCNKPDATTSGDKCNEIPNSELKPQETKALEEIDKVREEKPQCETEKVSVDNDSTSSENGGE